MLQGLVAIKSFLLIHDQELADEVLAFWRNCIELSVIEMIFGFLNLSKDLGRIVSLEGQISTNQGVEKYAQ